MTSALTNASEPTAMMEPREARAERLEDRLDLPMAGLAIVWALLVAYDLSGATPWRGPVLVLIEVIWVLFVIEFVTKLVVSGRPLVFLRRRWPSVLFLALPALRMLRVVRALRVLRALPSARVAGSSYRAIGTARSMLGDRLGVLVAVTLVAVFSGAQLAMVLEPAMVGSLGEALWWAGNVGITGNLVAEPSTVPGRVLSLGLSTYAVVVVASLAATVGAFFLGDHGRTVQDGVAEDRTAHDRSGVSTREGGGT